MRNTLLVAGLAVISASVCGMHKASISSTSTISKENGYGSIWISERSDIYRLGESNSSQKKKETANFVQNVVENVVPNKNKVNGVENVIPTNQSELRRFSSEKFVALQRTESFQSLRKFSSLTSLKNSKIYKFFSDVIFRSAKSVTGKD
jgi:hypothetical protein